MKFQPLNDDESRRRGFDLTDANSRKIALWGAIILAALLVSLAMLAFLFQWKVGSGNRIAYGSGQHVARSAYAESMSIPESWKELDAENLKHLHEYHWVDPANDVVQIPIERAMEIIARPAESP